MITEDYIRKEITVNTAREKFFLERYVKRTKEMSKLTIPKETVVHKHHIVPRWLGGVDEDYNLISVPIRHHLYLHKVLYQCLRSHSALSAVMVFSGHWNKRNGAFYQTRVKMVNQFYDQYIELQGSLTKGSIWLTDGKTDTRAKGEKAIQLLLDGWRRGRCSKSISGLVMVYDLLEKKNVKIPKDVYESSKERYRKFKNTMLVDMSKQENLPFVSFYSGDPSEIDNENILPLSRIAKKMKDGRWKLRSEITEDDEVNFEFGRDRMGVRFKGVYVTPYGMFKSIWDFERETSYNRGAVISLCTKRCDEEITELWYSRLRKDGSYPLTRNDIGKTPRQLGWYFIEKKDLDLEDLKVLYPDLDLTRVLS